VRAIDSLSHRQGQRVGIFGGSGVGKEYVWARCAATLCRRQRHSAHRRRNREVAEFLEKDLSPEGMRRSVVVVATSDMPAPCAFERHSSLSPSPIFRDAGRACCS